MNISPVISRVYRPSFQSSGKTETDTSKKKNLETLKSLGYCAALAGALAGGCESINIYKTMQVINECSVEPQQKYFESREDAMQYAFKKITEPLNKKSPFEYSVSINDETNEIISELKGDSTVTLSLSKSMYLNNKFNIKTETYTSIHGHPELKPKNYTSTFSFQDFVTLNYDENRSTSMAVTKDGEYFLLRKKDNYKKLGQKELNMLKNEYLEAWMNKERREETIKTKEYYGREIIDYPVMHEFWQRAAEKYNLEYETNYGSARKREEFF